MFKIDFFYIAHLPVSLLNRLLSLTLWRLSLNKMGVKSIIWYNVSISNPKYISIGNRVSIAGPGTIMALSGQKENIKPQLLIEDDVYIGRYCHIVCSEKVQIGKGSSLANNVHITDSNHGYKHKSIPIMKQKLIGIKKTIIGKNCFIGQNVNIMSGVTLGNNVVVGANSVVTKDLPSCSIAVGSPAKVIRTFKTISN